MNNHECTRAVCGWYCSPGDDGQPTRSISINYGDAGTVDGEGPCECEEHADDLPARVDFPDGRALALNPNVTTYPGGKNPVERATVARYDEAGKLTGTYTGRPDTVRAWYRDLIRQYTEEQR
jgi:hypothetical protein